MGTPGGNRLRALREYIGKTQLEVELDANLGMGYLQRVESGKVQHPEKDTLERILVALEARYTDQRDILELFGYVVNVPLPNAEDIRWAVEMCATELNEAVFPAYLLDCAHRLLMWNPLFPRLFPIRTAGLQYASMPRLLYDPRYGITSLISNPEVFLLAQMRAFRYETQWLHGEDWYQALVDELLRDCSLFRDFWTVSEHEQGYPTAARPLFPIELTLPEVGTLQFRLTSEPFALDRRFRAIYYLPADAKTLQQCVSWQEGK